MNFRVGQKVVCVDASHAPGCSRWGSPESVLTAGAVYTVREIGLNARGTAGVRLQERVLRGVYYHTRFEDNFYGAWRFRPAVERKTDISIFTKMLTDTRVTERV
jgi:hypothetical protein